MDELKDYFKLRSNIYILLGKIFHKEPTDEHLQELKKYVPVFEEIASTYENSSIPEGIKLLGSFLEEIKDKDMAAVTEKLATEFALIFLSTGLAEGIRGITPHESVYLSAQGLTMQEERDQVLEIYYNQGIGRNKNFKEPEDHMSAEMGFVAVMSTNTATEIENNNEEKIEALLNVQQGFLNKHLLRFAFRVCGDLYNMGSEYYKAAALITKGYLETDRIFIDTLLMDED